MAQFDMLAATTVRAEIAARLPRYDPLEEKRSYAGWVVTLISIALHLLVLWFFWDAVLGALERLEEVVAVEMFEPEETPKLERKVLQQTRIDTSVKQFKDILQPEIVEVQPIELNADLTRIQTEHVELTDAPKQVENRRITAKTVSVFSERPQAVARQLPTKAPTVPKRIVRAQRPTTGPRKVEAAAPVTNARAADISAPTLTSDRIGNTTAGDIEGARVADINSGVSKRAFEGAGDRGGLGTRAKNCNEDPVCRAYLEMIKKRVYGRWTTPDDVAGGKVKIRFRIDRGGSAHAIEVAESRDKLLGDSCLTAFRHASPFPPPPKEILYLVNKKILATFTTDEAE